MYDSVHGTNYYHESRNGKILLIKHTFCIHVCLLFPLHYYMYFMVNYSTSTSSVRKRGDSDPYKDTKFIFYAT